MNLIRITVIRPWSLVTLLFSTTIVWGLIACGTTTNGGGQATDPDATSLARQQSTKIRVTNS